MGVDASEVIGNTAKHVIKIKVKTAAYGWAGRQVQNAVQPVDMTASYINIKDI